MRPTEYQQGTSLAVVALPLSAKSFASSLGLCCVEWDWYVCEPQLKQSGWVGRHNVTKTKQQRTATTTTTTTTPATCRGCKQQLVFKRAAVGGREWPASCSFAPAYTIAAYNLQYGRRTYICLASPRISCLGLLYWLL